MSETVRVLHVDDEPDFGDMTAEFLETHSDRLEVVTESTPADALDELDERSIDCVVSDYQMGAANGLELLDEVRQRYPDLPFILFTGKGSEEIASEAISAGVTDYLQKETGTDVYAVLANRIENAVDQYHTEATLRQSEEELRQKSKMLDVILQHVPLHIYLKDEEARHTWVSDYYMGSSDQLGKTNLEYFDQDWARETHEEELEVMETGEPIIKDVRHDPGRDMWVLNSKVPWFDEDGEVVGLVGATWDITERKETKLQLERQTERLEKFIRALSHDLRNPLTLAAGELELAREDDDDPHLAAVADAHDRMDRILSETLTLARKGQTVGETQSVDLGAVARESWDTVETGGATLYVATDLTVEADPERLGQLLDNLFVNAVEHGSTNPRSSSTREDAVEHGSTSPDSHARQDATESSSPAIRKDGGVPPSVVVGSCERGFYVEDDGPGVDVEERDRVFDVGYTNADAGTGFGLAIVEEIAEAHGWSVDVEEGSDGGARFVVDL